MCAVQLITPRQAQSMLLSLGPDQRPIVPAIAFEFADAMRANCWHDTPETPIEINVDGSLANGQHRMLAVVLSRTVQPFPVKVRL